MATPNPRTNILLGRGTKANLTASLADILEGEIVFATDENLTYVKSGGSLVASAVSSVNSQSGAVVLDADDIDDTSTTNKFATAAQLAAADSATQPGDNVSTLTNDANYIDAAGAPVQSVAGKTGAVSLVKGDVGLGNVDDTSDANKPISTATQSALNLKADLVGGVVPNSQLPSLAITEYLGTVANQAALLALTGQRGDWAIRTDTGSTWVLTTDGGSTITDWTELATPADAVASVNGFTGTVVLGAGDVGAATTAQGALADTATQPGDNISTLTNDAGYITSAGAPGTDLTYTASTRVLASSTGTDATLPEVVAAGDSGLMTGSDKTKLDGVATGATNVTNNNQLTNGAGYITSADGGDAATLDGIDSTSFLRSDAADTKTSGDLTFNDNIELNFGTGGDLRIFHNTVVSTYSAIRNNTGDLYISTGEADKDVTILSDDSLGGLTQYFVADGSTGEAILYHYGNQKLATKSTGIDVTGNITVSGTVDGRDVAADGALAASATQPGDNISTLTNDAGYITSAGAPGTDLTYTASTRVLASSTGTDATLPEVVAAGDSGLMTGADKTKLDGIATGAEANVDTDLSYTASTRVLASSTGTNATLPEVVAAGDSGLMTGADKTKLDGIATGAEVNVDTDLSYTASTRVLASSTGTNATLPEVVAAGDSGLMTGSDKTKLDGIATGAEVNVDTDLSYTASTRVLASSTGTNATLPEVVAAGDSGLMTGADKTKLDGIATGATNVTNNNQLTNGAGYITATVTGDFTVDTSTLKVDSTNNRVGVGQATPIVDLDVDGAYAGNITAVGALDIDCSTANYFTKTISSNSTFTFSNAPSSRAYGFTLELTHTSGTITWPTSVKWPGDTAPTLSTGVTHLFTFITDDGGTRWRGASSVNYVN